VQEDIVRADRFGYSPRRGTLKTDQGSGLAAQVAGGSCTGAIFHGRIVSHGVPGRKKSIENAYFEPLTTVTSARVCVS
jgi:hypothetical protein